MENLLERDNERRLKHDILKSCIEDYGVYDVRDMLGLNSSQVSLTYKYSNDCGVPIPEKRFRVLSQKLTEKSPPDKRIVREYVSPNTLITLTPISGIKTNGSTHDELTDMIRELGEVEEHLKENPSDALVDIQQMRGILDRYEAEIRGMQ